ncbi:hypothetical protein [Nonomuraea sp. NPDC048916]|uniref:hypothetical protein n=1 Tax=Nonomuraea sp. NPDC048916 TaxID=3154232 RepID=UPI0033D7967E
MVLLGLILVLLAGGAIYVVATEESARYILFGYTFQPDQVEMFLVGAVTAAVLLAGLWMLGSGSRRSARRRRRIRSARAEESSRLARLEDEKRELERKLEHEHADTRTAPLPVREPAREPRHAAGDKLVARGSDDTRP